MPNLWIFIFVTEIIKYLLGLHIFFNLKLSKYKLWILGFGIMGYLLFIVTGILNDKLPILFSVIVSLCLIYNILDENRKNRIMSILKCMFIIICSDEIISRLFVFILKALTTDVNITSKPYYVLCNLIDIVILFILFMLKKYKKKDVTTVINFFKRFIYIGMFIIVFSMLLTVGELDFAMTYIDKPILVKTANFTSIISLIGILIFGILILYIIDLNKRIKESLNMERFLKNAQEDYYQAMLAKEESTRRFRHDINNHLLCIFELSQNGDNPGLEQYISNIIEEADKISGKIYNIGNDIIDIAMNYYLSQLSDAEIKIQGYINKEIDMKPTDICSVFSNIFKNVTEEFKSGEETLEKNKYLHIVVFNGNYNVKVNISNFMTNKAKIGEQGRLITRKSDIKNHGFGLKNIQDIMLKVGGGFCYEIKADEFIVEVILPVKTFHSR